MVTMNRNKVVIVGTGRVGATAAFGIVTHGLCNELVLIDCSAAKALGEARDLDDGSEFQDRHVKVRAGDYADCKDADIVVITVGRKPPANSNRMAELGFTVGLVGEVVDNVMASGFDGVIVMVSNPVDVMAWYAWKRSGLPRTQVLGTGTALDTSRLKTIIGEETGLDPRNVGGFVMGEHGELPVHRMVHRLARRQAIAALAAPDRSPPCPPPKSKRRPAPVAMRSSRPRAAPTRHRLHRGRHRTDHPCGNATPHRRPSSTCWTANTANMTCSSASPLNCAPMVPTRSSNSI